MRPHGPGRRPSRLHPAGVGSRLPLRRSPAAYWVAALALAAATGLLTLHLVGQAEAGAARYGRVRRVPITTRAVGAGAVLGPGDVRWERRPAAFVPSQSAAARSPIGHAALVPLVAGEVIVESRLAPGGLQGPAALLPPGWRALAVPSGHSSVTLATGDRVDVLATIDGTDPPTVAVSTGALIVGATPTAVTVAVPAEDAPRVAYALTRGVVTLALSADR